jgi:hypothetical protein
MVTLSARVRERTALTHADIESMYALFDLYYEGGSRAVFEHDLANKSHVIELHDGGRLRGFSTLALFGIEHLGKPVRALFSGDTIVNHENWGEQALARCFCQFAGSVKAQAPELPLFWLLISKGHRTYRYLHVFAHRYTPSFEEPPSPDEAALLNALCLHRFGDAYDPQRQVVRLDAAAATRLRPQWCDLRDNLRRHPEVALFLELNPHFAQGEELACLCELDISNLRSFALRAFRQGLRT